MDNMFTLRNCLLVACFAGIALFAEAQETPKLAGKEFYQVYNHKPGIMETHLRFISDTKATYIMKGKLAMSGASYIDECPCTVKITSGNITIKCNCLDKDIYPEPIEDSFTYNYNTKILSSTRNKDLKSKEYITWKQEN